MAGADTCGSTRSSARSERAARGCASCWENLPGWPWPRPEWAAELARAAAWEGWTAAGARPEQRPPEDEAWRTWALLGGRGSGKTRAGAEWLQGRAWRGARLALVGATLHDVREVMVGGPSGLAAIAPEGCRPVYEVSRRRLVWPNGAEAFAFSAEDPDSLRGPQFETAWADEFCAWAHPGETLAMLRFGLRLGAAPKLAVTTTPRPLGALRRLLAEGATRRSDARTADNAGNLAAGFIEDLRAMYGGTRMEAQELEGVLLDAPEGALFRAEEMIRARVSGADAVPRGFDKMVVAVDPPAGPSTELRTGSMDGSGSACGIVAAGRLGERAYVLADRSARGLTPLGWARRASALAAEVGAGLIVAEANQGGEMVAQVLKQAGTPCPVRLVRASTGKRARAEPVAALYEQGRVTHCGALCELEEELMALGSAEARGSFDRADALVWALSELMLRDRAGPRIRVL